MIDVWERMRATFNPNIGSSGNSEPQSCENSFEAYLASLDEEGDSAADNDIREDLLNLCRGPRLRLNTKGSEPETILDYWLRMKSSKPDLYKLASVLLGIPCTQVSVERAFSALALVLTKQRTLLGEDTLADILLIRLNQELFKNIDFKKV